MRGRHRARKELLTVADYATDLPDGVSLVWAPQMQRYKLIKGSVVLAMRRPDEVEMWENPERVFAYIARRQMSKAGRP